MISQHQRYQLLKFSNGIFFSLDADYVVDDILSALCGRVYLLPAIDLPSLLQ